jgi:hypothetical protein
MEAEANCPEPNVFQNCRNEFDILMVLPTAVALLHQTRKVQQQRSIYRVVEKHQQVTNLRETALQARVVVGEFPVVGQQAGCFRCRETPSLHS